MRSLYARAVSALTSQVGSTSPAFGPGIEQPHVRLGPLVEASFLERLNRFAATVYVDRKTTLVHVANSGRMKELLVQGNRVWLKPAGHDGRKTAYDLALVDLGHTLASADARLPNQLVAASVARGQLSQFASFTKARQEVTYGDSRLDMSLEGDAGTCYVEAKSVTLVVNGAGLFPDAPTVRGRKHLQALSRAVLHGHRAAVVFVVQRADAQAFSPNDPADPAFGQELREAQLAGVEIYAYRCHVSLHGVTLADRLPVEL